MRPRAVGPASSSKQRQSSELQFLSRTDKIDGADVPETEGVTLMLDRVRIIDQDGTFYGTLQDEIGGSWSFKPRGPQEPV